ncbi:hypothetical protein IQ243_24595 [Nostocales cyanobacterium LEGE 11386]|nr:hypothetical protein [Nostocales cyanobacterium LEGE 11386]
MFTTCNLKAGTAIAVLSASILSSSSVLAQISPETASALTSPTVSGSWSTNRVQEFYYSFTSAPGQLQVTLDTIGDSPGCQTVRVTILDRERRDWRNNRQVYGSFFKLACRSRGTPKIENFSIPERRPLLMRVSAEDFSGGTPYSGNYTVTLGGSFEGQPQLQQIDPKLLREQKFLALPD